MSSFRLPLAFVFLIAVVVSACGPATPAAGPAPSAAAAAKLPDNLVIHAVTGTMATIDPPSVNSVALTSGLRLFYEPLFTYVGADVNKIVPHLATSYAATPDFKTHTVKLRTDVKFSDGTAMTSADVVFTLNRIKNRKNVAAFLMAGLTVAAPDPTTVVITSATPVPALLPLLTIYQMGIQNSKVVKANGGTDAADADKTDTATRFLDKNSAGSGPYTLTEFTPGNKVIATASPTYWGSAKPVFKQVIIENVLGPQQLLNVQKGVAQVVLDLSTQQARSAKLDPTPEVPAGLQLNAASGLQQFFLIFNMNAAFSKLSSNLDFRQAVRFGIDYEAIRKIGGEGAATPTSPFAPSIPGALPASDAPKRDVAKAKAALAKANVGANPTLTMLIPSDTPFAGLVHQDFAEIIQANLLEVGIKVVINSKPNATAFPELTGGKSEVGLFLHSRVPDPAYWADVMCPGVASGLPGGWAQWPKGNDPETDRLCTAASAAGPDTRMAAYAALQRRMNETGPYVPLINPAVNIIADKRISNAVFSPGHRLDLYQLGR